MLIANRLFSLVHAIRVNATQQDHDSAGQVSPDTGRLLLTGLALSIDNPAVGFALGADHVSLSVAVATIGAVSVTMSLIGLELGHWHGKRTRDRGAILGGLVLIGVGPAIAGGGVRDDPATGRRCARPRAVSASAARPHIGHMAVIAW